MFFIFVVLITLSTCKSRGLKELPRKGYDAWLVLRRQISSTLHHFSAFSPELI